MRPYFDNRAGRVTDHYADYVGLTYHPGARTPDDLRELLSHVTRLLAQYDHGRVLVDQRQMQPFTMSEQQQVRQWLPQAVALGIYRSGAILQAHDALARLATAAATTDSRELSLTYHYFDDEAAAVAWLTAQP